MKTNKLDNNIKEKFANRTLEPSVSAWERLSAQLDEQPQQKKKGWFFYIGYAASILILISVGFYLFSEDEQIVIPKNIIVHTKIDTISINNKINEIFNEVPIEEAIVKNDKATQKQENIMKPKAFIPKKKEATTRKVIAKNKPKQIEKTRIAKFKEKTQNVIPNLEVSGEESKVSETVQTVKNSRIKVNAEDLLYAVTHTPNEVKTYYAKYNVSRDAILKTIKSELKKSNLKVNPETILAEVEQSIHEDDFQNNFLKSLKKKISNIATAIASRND
ncbi:hypothetical protein [uncultured Polaribacter sp.]|uniref:hypothetical protein n=1 Tax=uncultured Polaribacter sp. TaxID=174711 RepID=UPI002612B042|nr:hypothetical protein [uncultured Polaribacter sp.]